MHILTYLAAMKKRIIIAGPTASGKSTLAVELAEKTGGEIISVDSRQCYKLIDIGTAKPSQEDLDRIPHHNISALDLNEKDSAASFRARAERWAADIEARGKTVIYCGGSTLHLQSLIHPLDEIPSSDSQNVDLLNRRADREGVEVLYKELIKCDPDYAKSMDGMNRQRIIRALDVWMQTGEPFSSFHQNKPVSLPDSISFFALHHPRKVLHSLIEKRSDQMIAQGIVKETRQILDLGYSPDIQALQTVGYKQVIQYLKGEISHQQMTRDIKTATRRYAKRQITWLRRWKFTDWINMHTIGNEKAVSYIEQQVAADKQKG
jgi:tRNA dimethylallyltransferase